MPLTKENNISERRFFKMKKKITKAIILSLTLIMILSGCSSNNTATTKVNYDWAECIELGEYKELPYYTETFEVTDEEVDAEIETILLYATEMETVTEGIVEDGDTINIAFVGKVDGEEFEGGSSQSYDLTVGTTSMIDGFVEGLIGKNIGETVTLNLKFPDDYHSTELQGKDVVFDITINNKRISTTPELTDEFVKNYYEAENVEDFKQKIREDLLSSKENAVNSSIKSNLWDVIIKNTEIKSVPAEEEEAAKAQVEAIEEDYRATAESYGLEWADFLTTLMGTTEEGFQETMKEYEDNIVKSNIITKAIADKEGITLSDKDYKEKVKEILDANNLTEESFESYYNMSIYDYADENGWRDSILQDMILDKVLELGKEVSKDEYQKFISDTLYDGEEIHMHDDGTVHEASAHEEEATHDHDHEGEDVETEAGTEDEAETETDKEDSEG